MSPKEHALVSVLEDAIERIKSGKCGMDSDELEDLAIALCHYKVTLEEVCNRKHFSRATLNRKMLSGEFPQPKKEAGGKKYFWWDEVRNL